MNIYELSPNGRQKSFYGKAVVFTNGTTKLLKSYDTLVAAVTVEDGIETFHRLWGGWSATTAKHLSAFTDLYPGKKAWDELPLESISNLNTMLNFLWGVK